MTVSRISRQVSVLEECLYGYYYAAPDDIYHIRGIRGRRYLGGALSSTLVPLQTKLSESDPGYGIVSRGGHTTNNVSSSTDPVTVDNKEDMK